ncbi:MAG: ATP-binding cassette domain-containing protein [Peptococcaceae bacterium]|jgi:peptide/nickel transport system ATP-binding protein/oligopeptide transport system ATP-binding protein|nr:ATP-binding cassette domain-containing protein [Peptococcaceae bacterium]
MPLLEVEALRKYYRGRGRWRPGKERLIPAVDGISFQVEEGSALGLVGESGCGKTTTGRLILRLETPTAGSIRFDGQDILALRGERLRSWRQQAQMVFQDPQASLHPAMTVGEAIAEPLAYHSALSRREREERARELLAEVGLETVYFHRFPQELSGGQRQRVGIARALSLNPRLLVADEPLSALDVSIQAQILNLFIDLKERRRLTYIFISHNLAVVRRLCDQVGVMYEGRLVELQPVGDLFRAPGHPYTRALLRAIPRLEGRRRE